MPLTKLMSDSALSDPRSQTGTPNRLTRCRTGCLRCRVRRRKCDEGKPRCRNCTERNFECQYGPQLSFLTKNAFTVPPSQIHSTASHPNYEVIRFVSEDPQRYLDENASWEDLSSSTDNSIGFALPQSPETSLPPREDNRNISTSHKGLSRDLQETPASAGPSSPLWAPLDISIGNLHPQHQQPIQENPQRNNSHSHPSHQGYRSPQFTGHSRRSFSDNDEFAISGLLALGAVPNDSSLLVSHLVSRSEPRHHRTNSSSSITPGTLGPGDGSTDANALSTSGTTTMVPPSGTHLSPSVTLVERVVTSNRALELLRYYRYEVAPWLDVCDMWQSFGITAAQMAMNSESILYALLALSETSSQDLHHPADATTYFARSQPLHHSFSPIISDSRVELTETGVATVLERVRYFTTNPSQAWEQNTAPDTNLMNALVLQASGTDLVSSTYWLFLRLELSAALANDSKLRISLPLSIPWNHPTTFDTEAKEDLFGRVFYYAHQSLLMLAQAVQIIQGEAPATVQSTQPIRLSLIDRWKQLAEELHRWYRQRPQEFQPMLDFPSTDGPGAGFSIILFTNGASVFGNQLYHTAMLLLLLNKPRTVGVTDLPSFILSPLWHAQRICSIALNNDRRECWDLCLLASLLVAARRMTHEFQQREILNGFDRIRALTGWNMGESITQLQGDWRLLDAI